MNEKINHLFGKQLDFYKSRGADLNDKDKPLKVFVLHKDIDELKCLYVHDLEKYIEPLMKVFTFQGFYRTYTPVLVGSHKKYWKLINE